MGKLRGIWEVFDNPQEYGKLAETGMLVLKLAFMIFVGLIIIKIVLKLMKKALDKSYLDPSLYRFIINAVKVILLIILITMCLGALGVHMSTIIAVIGAAGAAIALALRDSLANIAGGVMIIITQPFKRDDFIDVGEISGKVESIDLFLTTLRTYDNKMITIPNGVINTSILINHSRETSRRVDCQFGIAYESDIAKAKQILMEVCGRNEMIFSEPEPVTGVAEHGDSAVLIDLKVWCDTDNYWDVKYFLEENVKLAFDEGGIDIPYPKMSVQVQK